MCQAFGNPDELEEIYGQIDQAHENDLSEMKKNDDITYSDALSMAKMAGGISFYQNLRSCQTYEVPVVTERGVTACHVTIRNGDGRKGFHGLGTIWKGSGDVSCERCPCPRVCHCGATGKHGVVPGIAGWF